MEVRVINNGYITQHLVDGEDFESYNKDERLNILSQLLNDLPEETYIEILEVLLEQNDKLIPDFIDYDSIDNYNVKLILWQN